MVERVLISIATESDSGFECLQAELARIDLLIHREIACRQRAGQDPSDAFRGLTWWTSIPSNPAATGVLVHGGPASHSREGFRVRPWWIWDRRTP